MDWVYTGRRMKKCDVTGSDAKKLQCFAFIKYCKIIIGLVHVEFRLILSNNQEDLDPPPPREY